MRIIISTLEDRFNWTHSLTILFKRKLIFCVLGGGETDGHFTFYVDLNGAMQRWAVAALVYYTFAAAATTKRPRKHQLTD